MPQYAIAENEQLSPVAQSRALVTGVDWSTWFDHFWQAKDAADYATSLTDILLGQVAVEGNDEVPWAGPTGWDFTAGDAKWLDTQLTPANDQSWSVMVQYAGVVNTGALCGVQSGAARRMMLRPDSGGNAVAYQNGGTRTQAPRLLTGNLAIAGNQGYRNGIADGAAIGVWVGTSDFSIHIGGRSNLGAGAFFISANIIAVGIKKGPALTAPEVLAARTAMQALADA